MAYVIKSKNMYLRERNVNFWVDQLERATVFEDDEKSYAEEVAQNYSDEGRETIVQPIIMEEKK